MLEHALIEARGQLPEGFRTSFHKEVLRGALRTSSVSIAVGGATADPTTNHEDAKAPHTIQFWIMSPRQRIRSRARGR